MNWLLTNAMLKTNVVKIALIIEFSKSMMAGMKNGHSSHFSPNAVNDSAIARLFSVYNGFDEAGGIDNAWKK